MGHRYLVAVALIASCSPPAHPKKPPRPERVAREPDDLPSGAVAIALVDGKGAHHGTLDGPATDTVDWLRLDRPAGEGGYVIELRARSSEVWLKFFDGATELGATHSARVNDATTFQLAAAPPQLLLEVSDLEREAGSYDLAIAFAVAPPVPVDAAVDAAPDARLRYCAVGEVADDCHRAPPCDWTKVDPANPRCAPEQRPR